MSETVLRVFVSGATGYLGSWIVFKLLEKGFHVNAGVRDVNDTTKVSFLSVMLPEKKHLLNLVATNIETGEGVSDAIQGCHYIIHTAIPENWDSESDSYIDSIRCVLDAALKHHVKRIVVTSSMATICGNQRELDPDHVWTSDDWNLTPTSQYSKGKTAAEKFAWDFVREHPELELTVVHPTFVLGPSLSPRLTSSLKMWFNICNGTALNEGGVLPVVFGLCNVVDIAEVHLNAMEKPEAKGQRYLCASVSSYTLLDFVGMVKDSFPTLPWPTSIKNDVVLRTKPVSTDDTKFILILGRNPTPLQQTLTDTIKSFIHHKLIGTSGNEIN